MTCILSTSTKKTLKTLTLAENVAVIGEVQKGGKKKSEIAADFGIPRNTLSTYLKNKDKIIQHYSNSQANQSRRRCRETTNEELNGCVTKWLKQTRDKKIPTFKQRHNIIAKKVCGENAAVHMKVAEEWTENLLEKIRGVDHRDIFNADETALFYECSPNKTLASKGENCSNGKLNKVRITVLVGANSDDIEKLSLLTIGKSVNPRCFKNFKTKPCEYESNNKA
ncbi:tigger transposable element-derived protein 4-like [Phymastichus coffea]|uniref:tigger transposable element-derived protein 4-like n=1 Tax=Phymastichus coffea TaxID=108790 RepID=UPI00273C680D|nr:tigger transposable element-derived protein 4-like [Phymastichus coffea]